MNVSSGSADTGLPLHYLAWATALLPFVTTHVSYLLAASQGHVDWCMPYWDSCTSISATGRQLPEKIWFKAMMIPSAMLSMLLWWAAAVWRRSVAPSHYPKTLGALPLLGFIAASALIMYTAALGEEGGTYRLLRRTGVVLSFALTFICQVLLTRLIGELARYRQDTHLQRWHHRLLALLSTLLAVGVLSLILEATLGPGYDQIEDALEWIMALLLNLYFVALGLIWKKDGAQLTVS